MKRPNIIRPIRLHTTIPEDLYGKLFAHLYSPAENRVPQGAFQRFICDRIREYFDPTLRDLLHDRTDQR